MTPEEHPYMTIASIDIHDPNLDINPTQACGFDKDFNQVELNIDI